MLGKDQKIDGPGTVVGANVKLTGTLKDLGDIVVHGKVEGEVISEKNITISETAYIKGPITAETVNVGGKVKGSIVASSKLELLPTGRVYGSITAKDLNIKSGAIFVGKSQMQGEKEAEEAIATEETEEATTPEAVQEGELSYEVES